MTVDRTTNTDYEEPLVIHDEDFVKRFMTLLGSNSRSSRNGFFSLPSLKLWLVNIFPF